MVAKLTLDSQICDDYSEASNNFVDFSFKMTFFLNFKRKWNVNLAERIYNATQIRNFPLPVCIIKKFYAEQFKQSF